MRNVILVIKHEVSRTIGNPTFWFTAFVFPLLIFTMTFGSQLLAQGLTEEETEGGLIPGISGETDPAEQKPVGYVDQAGVVQEIPPQIPEGLLQAFPDRAAANAALETNEIDQYYLVPQDFEDSSDVVLIQDNFAPLQQLGDSLFEYVIVYNLVGDPDVAVLVQNPMPSVTTQPLTPPEEPSGNGDGSGTPSMAPMVMLFIFFFVLTMSSGFMLRSVTREKENRVVEVLLLSVRPRDLMLGKILGLGFVALVQMAIWLGGVVLILGERSPIVGLASQALSLTLPPSFFVWIALYFLLGYITFASALGALGSLAPNMREGSQYTFLVLLPLMIPLWLNAAFIEAPNGTLATFLSIFPLTSPVSMISRLAATTVPLWQILLSLGLLAATTYGFVLLAARFFRSDTLLSSAPLNLRRIRDELLGKTA